MKIKKSIFSGFLIAILIGCGGSSSKSTSSYQTTGKLVDPYIVGAVLYQDENNNSKYDDGELISSKTDENGEFSFEEELTFGAVIRIKEHGIHEGVIFDLNLTGIVDGERKIDVVSPLTTLNTKGLTTTQIAEILNKAANDESINGWSITADQILIDPLSGDLMNKKVSDITDDDLVTIQASIATYGLLKIMNGSATLKELNATALYDSGMNQNGHDEVNKIMRAMLDGVTKSLTKSLLITIKDNIVNGQNSIVSGLKSGGYPGDAESFTKKAMPEPSVEIVVKVAVIVMDRLAQIGYEICNSTDGDAEAKVTAALNGVASSVNSLLSQIDTLGMKLYGMEYQSHLKALKNVFGRDVLQNLPQEIQEGYNYRLSNKTTYRFDQNNNLEAR